MEAGDLVKIRDKYNDNLIGVLMWVDMRYPPQCCVLVDGKTTLEDLRVVEVVE